MLAGTYIAMNGIFFDAMVQSNIFLNSLPYTRKEIVAAKYIGAIVYMILSMGVAGIALYVFNYNYSLRDIAIAIGLSLIFIALVFPLFYLLKPIYIGTLIFIALIIMAAIMPPVFRFLAEHFTAIADFLMSLSTTTLYLSGAAISISFFLISWMVSQFIYLRKVF